MYRICAYRNGKKKFGSSALLMDQRCTEKYVKERIEQKEIYVRVYYTLIQYIYTYIYIYIYINTLLLFFIMPLGQQIFRLNGKYCTVYALGLN